LAPNIKDLHLRNLVINPRKLMKNDIECHLPQLRKLEMISVKGFELIGPVLESAFRSQQLEHLKVCWTQQSDWKSYEKLIHSCANLSFLALDQVVIDNFQYSMHNLGSNLKLKKLILNEVRIPQKEAFEGFTAFIKTLKSVQDLDLDIQQDELDNRNNYSEILSHLFNLETLDRINFRFLNLFNMLQQLEVVNPNVKNVLIGSRVGIVRKKYVFLCQYFPNAQIIAEGMIGD
jgi:hypothetical protein